MLLLHYVLHKNILPFHEHFESIRKGGISNLRYSAITTLISTNNSLVAENNGNGATTNLHHHIPQAGGV